MAHWAGNYVKTIQDLATSTVHNLLTQHPIATGSIQSSYNTVQKIHDT